jgi:hypothetical protein
LGIPALGAAPTAPGELATNKNPSLLSAVRGGITSV